MNIAPILVIFGSFSDLAPPWIVKNKTGSFDWGIRPNSIDSMGGRLVRVSWVGSCLSMVRVEKVVTQ